MYIILPLFLMIFTANAAIPPINHKLYPSESEYKNEIKRRMRNNERVRNECIEIEKRGGMCPIGGMAVVTDEEERLVEGEL
jgi:hypothetical protein